MNTHLDDDRYGIRGIRAATLRNRGVKIALSVIVALSVFVTLGVVARSVHRPPLAQGDVQATETKVAPKAIGQKQAMPATKENDVEKEQLLVSSKNQDSQASPEQARAAMESAKEHNRRVQAACAEYICAQSNWWVKASAVAERTQQNVTHSRALQATGVISPGELQELERGLDWARSCERAAKASLDLAVALFGSEGHLASATIEPPTSRVAEFEASVAERAITNSIPRVPTAEP